LLLPKGREREDEERDERILLQVRKDEERELLRVQRMQEAKENKARHACSLSSSLSALLFALLPSLLLVMPSSDPLYALSLLSSRHKALVTQQQINAASKPKSAGNTTATSL
jgi:hypothetical protein